jgi:hypothetical protein
LSSPFDDTTKEESISTSLGSSIHSEMAETNKTLREVKLNPLKPFTGKQNEYK